MRDNGGGGHGAGDRSAASIDEMALGQFVDTSERLAGELATRVGDAEALDRRVRNLSTDFATGSTALDDAVALAVRWATAAATVERIRTGTIAADRFMPEAVATAVTQPAEPDAGLDLGHHIQTLAPDADFDLGRHIQLGAPDDGVGILIQTGDPDDPDLGTETQGSDDELTFDSLAGKKRRAAKPADTQPVPTGPVTRPTDPYALVAVHGKLYPAHQVTFWPTGTTTPAGPAGKPQPLYETKLLGEGGPHVDNNTVINTAATASGTSTSRTPAQGNDPASSISSTRSRDAPSATCTTSTPTSSSPVRTTTECHVGWRRRSADRRSSPLRSTRLETP